MPICSCCLPKLLTFFEVNLNVVCVYFVAHYEYDIVFIGLRSQILIHLFSPVSCLVEGAELGHIVRDDAGVSVTIVLLCDCVKHFHACSIGEFCIQFLCFARLFVYHHYYLFFDVFGLGGGSILLSELIIEKLLDDGGLTDVGCAEHYYFESFLLLLYHYLDL